MKYKWMLLIGLVSLMVIVAGCGLTPGESIAGQASKQRGVDKSQYKAPRSAPEKIQTAQRVPSQLPEEMPSYQELLIKPEVVAVEKISIPNTLYWGCNNPPFKTSQSCLENALSTYNNAGCYDIKAPKGCTKASWGGWDCNLESNMCAKPLKGEMGEKKKECPQGYNSKEDTFGPICIKS